jgi:coproporphyrinogen III oxidase
MIGRAARRFNQAPTKETIVDGNIFNSSGVQVGIVRGGLAFNLKGEKLYRIKGANIYKLTGALVGHLGDPQNAERHLSKATDKLFSGV